MVDIEGSETYLSNDGEPIIHGKCLDHPTTAVYSEECGDSRQDQKHIRNRSDLRASSIGSHNKGMTSGFPVDAQVVERKYKNERRRLLNHNMIIELRISTLGKFSKALKRTYTVLYMRHLAPSGE